MFFYVLVLLSLSMSFIISSVSRPTRSAVLSEMVVSLPFHSVLEWMMDGSATFWLFIFSAWPTFPIACESYVKTTWHNHKHYHIIYIYLYLKFLWSFQFVTLQITTKFSTVMLIKIISDIEFFLCVLNIFNIYYHRSFFCFMPYLLVDFIFEFWSFVLMFLIFYYYQNVTYCFGQSWSVMINE